MQRMTHLSLNFEYKNARDMELKDPSLLKTGAYINGEWLNFSNTFPVLNPATGEEIAAVSDCGVDQAKEAIDGANEAFQSWKSNTAEQRQSILLKWYQLILNNAADLAKIMTTEQGKPLAEARAEVNYGASFIKWFAEEGRRTYGDVIPSSSSSSRIITLKQPIGVCVAITPWNFPLAMITRKIAPALAVGCTVVVKPAEDTPLTALALAELAEQAGLPKGVLNVITCHSAEEVGTFLTTHPNVRKISFTGSTEVGKILMKNAAENITKISLELGGNAPFLVFDDADVEAAAEGAIASKYRNAGQTCICANRILVQDGVYDDFMKAYSAKVKNLKVGNGTEEGVQIGPLINQQGLDKVKRLLDDATSHGGKLTLGGKADHDLFFQPTIIENVDASMDIHSEEIFGPVSAIYKFSTEEEGIHMANNTIYGLAAYFYSENMSRVWRVSEALEYGMIGVNTGAISTAIAPFGGVKQSGIGREGSKYGVDEYLEVKYVNMGV